MGFIAAIVAGIYGAIHDQISYTLSSEYFTQFKFIQFNLTWAYEYPRIGAASIGFLASWWMGILVFVLLGWIGFFFPTPRLMGKHLSYAFFVVLVVATITSACGLGFGYYHVNESTQGNYIHWVPSAVIDTVQFVRVGFMHNASYAGGLVGLIFGVGYLVIAKIRISR